MDAPACECKSKAHPETKVRLSAACPPNFAKDAIKSWSLPIMHRKVLISRALALLWALCNFTAAGDSLGWLLGLNIRLDTESKRQQRDRGWHSHTRDAESLAKSPLPIHCCHGSVVVWRDQRWPWTPMAHPSAASQCHNHREAEQSGSNNYHVNLVLVRLSQRESTIIKMNMLSCVCHEVCRLAHTLPIPVKGLDWIG